MNFQTFVLIIALVGSVSSAPSKFLGDRLDNGLYTVLISDC